MSDSNDFSGNLCSDSYLEIGLGVNHENETNYVKRRFCSIADKNIVNVSSFLLKFHEIFILVSFQSMLSYSNRIYLRYKSTQQLILAGNNSERGFKLRYSTMQSARKVVIVKKDEEEKPKVDYSWAKYLLTSVTAVTVLLIFLAMIYVWRRRNMVKLV